jgi:two-component system cell cycle response regulator
MTGLGLLMGLVFPFFVALMGIPTGYVFTPWFFAATLSAGFVVGAVNIGLARSVVGRRLRLLADRMVHVRTNLDQIAADGNLDRCQPADCYVPADSDDELGQSAQAFNHLVESLFLSLNAQAGVRTFTEMLASQLELSVLADKALEQLSAQLHAHAGVILIESGGEIKVLAANGVRTPGDIVNSDLVQRAMRTEQRQSIALPDDIVLEGVLTDFRPREVLVDPIFYKHVALGAIVLASSAGFAAEERSRLDLFRQGLALALHNAIIHDRLQRLAALDPLTGVYNRRFGLERLHEEFGRAVRATSPIGVLMFDLDHFKNVNDSYGHLVGDRMLSLVAKTARAVIREGDILVRYGGEEFLVILPAASREDAAKIAERLRRLVADAALSDQQQTIKVTVSIGCTAYPELDVKNETELVDAADKALYNAKALGRNRVIAG